MSNSVYESMEYDVAVKHRLNRIEGQIRGVLSMMEKDKECRDVVTQLSAIRSAIDRTIASIVVQNMQTCIREEIINGNEPDKVLAEGINLLVKSR